MLSRKNFQNFIFGSFFFNRGDDTCRTINSFYVSRETQDPYQQNIKKKIRLSEYAKLKY